MGLHGESFWIGGHSLGPVSYPDTWVSLVDSICAETGVPPPHEFFAGPSRGIYTPFSQIRNLKLSQRGKPSLWGEKFSSFRAEESSSPKMRPPQRRTALFKNTTPERPPSDEETKKGLPLPEGSFSLPVPADNGVAVLLSLPGRKEYFTRRAAYFIPLPRSHSRARRHLQPLLPHRLLALPRSPYYHPARHLHTSPAPCV